MSNNAIGIAASILVSAFYFSWMIGAASNNIRKRIAIVADRLLDIQNILEKRR